jgi:hypothetical protein
MSCAARQRIAQRPCRAPRPLPSPTAPRHRNTNSPRSTSVGVWSSSGRRHELLPNAHRPGGTPQHAPPVGLVAQAQAERGVQGRAIGGVRGGEGGDEVAGLADQRFELVPARRWPVRFLDSTQVSFRSRLFGLDLAAHSRESDRGVGRQWDLPVTRPDQTGRGSALAL